MAAKTKTTKTPAATAAAHKKLAAAGKKAAATRTAAARSESAQDAAATRKANAAKAAKATGRTKVPAKPRTAPAASAGWLHELPACAAVAVTCSREWATGHRTPAELTARLWHDAGLLIPEVAVAAGATPYPVDPDAPRDGSVLGIKLPDGRLHAVLVIGGEWLSWGVLQAPAGIAEEAWLLDWPQ